MSNIEFENIGYQNQFTPENKDSFLIHLVIKSKLVQNEKQATFVLVLVAVTAVIVTMIVLHSTFTPNGAEKLTPAQVQAILDKTNHRPAN